MTHNDRRNRRPASTSSTARPMPAGPRPSTDPFLDPGPSVWGTPDDSSSSTTCDTSSGSSSSSCGE
ncbi:hypothetical protein [[Kitasatospora] papulosa]|uniref:hypothetical protein n=1 Tax=[Kitasatospora] papulosa TaxID=1464011 RepID=UPI003687FD4C